MFFKYNVPGIVWAVIILVLLGLPPNDLPDTSFLNIPHKDKIIHAGLFLILVVLLARGFALQDTFAALSKHFLLISFFISIAYGALTEILQGTIFTGRTADIFDFIFDLIGSIAGLLIFLLLKRKLVGQKIKKKIHPMS
jgi:VanZ family protein